LASKPKKDGKVQLTSGEMSYYNERTRTLEDGVARFEEELTTLSDAEAKFKEERTTRLRELTDELTAPFYKEADDFLSAMFKQNNIIPIQSEGDLVVRSGNSDVTENLIQAYKNYLMSNHMPVSFSVPETKVSLLNMNLVDKAREENKELIRLYKVMNSYVDKKNVNVLLNSSEIIPTGIAADADLTADFLIYYKEQQALAFKEEQALEREREIRNKVEDFYSAGDSAVNQRDFNTAITEFTKAVEMNAKHAQSYAGRGYAYLNLKKYDLALADFNKAIDLESDSFFAYHFRGHTYRKQNKLDLAFADFSKAINRCSDKVGYEKAEHLG